MRRPICLAILALVAHPPLAAQAATHVLIVTGLSAEPAFARTFGAEAGALYDAAHGAWRVADSDLVYLAEDPAADRRISGKSTRENVAAAFVTMARRIHPGDVALIVLIGHGAGELAASTVNLPGPDPTAADYAGWLFPLRTAAVVFVNTASASGDFGAVLAGANRVVITATRTAYERNETEFGKFFVQGLVGTEADADKDGKVSVAEAFRFAAAEVVKSYESSTRMLTEHATMIDSSAMATRLTFGGDVASADPRVAALIGERRVLEAQVDSLRRTKATADSTRYQHDLEQLLLAIAGKTQAIKALQGVRP